MDLDQEKVINQIEKEHENHHEKIINCIKCYPITYLKTRPEYVRFWNWISTDHGAIKGTGATEIIFQEIFNNKQIRENADEMKKRIETLFKSIHYTKIYA